MSFKVALVGLDGPGTPGWVTERLAAEQIGFAMRECTTPAELAETAGDADVVWIFGGSRIVSDETLPLLARCGAIIRTGSGTDNVPVEAATRLGIVVANTPEALNEAVADHAVALLLAAARQVAVQDRAVRRGTWDRAVAWPRFRLQGQTLGLIGFGHIARAVARKLRGFEMQVLVFDPKLDAARITAQGARPAALQEVLAEADFLSIHCPLTPETRHLIGAAELHRMKPDAILVNTSRGPVVDEAALVRALRENWIAAAGLDVLEREPPDPDNPLLGLDNVVLTPHIAGYWPGYEEAAWRLSVETVLDLARGHWPRSYVNPGVRPRMSLKS
jgi:D-3-phosphoglycerate dehydrogenase